MLFTLDRIELWKQNARGAMQVWSIEAQGNTITITWGQEGCELQTYTEEVPAGKAGRTLEEQVLLQVNSRIQKKLDDGYLKSKVQAATSKPTNALGLSLPMLAQNFRDLKRFDETKAWVQPKLDGHRCLIHRASFDELIAYSRRGKPITTISEVLNEVDSMNIPVGMTLDGELYLHGTKVETVTSYVKKRQDNTRLLAYHVYDVVLDERFGVRLSTLDKIHFSNRFVKRVPSIPMRRVPDLSKWLSETIAMGYEGLMIRTDTHDYQDGKRSRSLLKLKSFLDDEFTVIKVEASRDGHGILVMMTDKGKEFKATAPGTFQEKESVLRNLPDYVGRQVQIKYAGFTTQGKPFHPVAVRWREDDDA